MLVRIYHPTENQNFTNIFKDFLNLRLPHTHMLTYNYFYIQGRQQADLTGQRLANLNIKWDLLVRSTMTRAQETATIIAKHLDKNIQVKDCQLIEEGAPVPPEPPVGHWRPEPKVSWILQFYLVQWSVNYPNFVQQNDSLTKLLRPPDSRMRKLIKMPKRKRAFNCI